MDVGDTVQHRATGMVGRILSIRRELSGQLCHRVRWNDGGGASYYEHELRFLLPPLPSSEHVTPRGGMDLAVAGTDMTAVQVMEQRERDRVAVLNHNVQGMAMSMFTDAQLRAAMQLADDRTVTGRMSAPAQMRTFPMLMNGEDFPQLIESPEAPEMLPREPVGELTWYASDEDGSDYVAVLYEAAIEAVLAGEGGSRTFEMLDDRHRPFRVTIKIELPEDEAPTTLSDKPKLFGGKRRVTGL
jgi:hypothetical protein